MLYFMDLDVVTKHEESAHARFCIAQRKTKKRNNMFQLLENLKDESMQEYLHINDDIMMDYLTVFWRTLLRSEGLLVLKSGKETEKPNHTRDSKLQGLPRIH